MIAAYASEPRTLTSTFAPNISAGGASGLREAIARATAYRLIGDHIMGSGSI